MVKDYAGTGPLAEMQALADELERQEEEERRQVDQAERERLALLDSSVREAWQAVDAVVNAAMLLGGYRKHNRGEWRRSRG